MKKKLAIIKDAAAEILGFPWSKPVEPTSRSTTSTGFPETVTDTDLLNAFLRNPTANAVVADVAYDAVGEFQIQTKNKEQDKELDAEVQEIFETHIEKTIKKALLFTRLYGFCGILVGYADGKKLDEPADKKAKIKYLQVIPKTWINDVVSKKDKAGNTQIPIELEKYEVNMGNAIAKTDIDASRLVHIMNRSIQEESLEGVSSLLRIFDALTVMKSMVWGTGQALWRNGAGLTVFIAPDSDDPQTQINAIDEVTTDINTMTVLTMPPGTEVVTGSTGAINPKEYFDVITKQIAIGTRIPTSILTGSQAGTLTASEKDRGDYAQLLASIQDTVLTPALYDLLHRLQESKQISRNGDFRIDWVKPSIKALEEAKEKELITRSELNTARTKLEEANAKNAELDYKEKKEQMALWET